MKKARFTADQINYALRQVYSWVPPADVCRQLGCSEASFCIWKKRCGNLGITEVRELRQLRDENSRLKRLVADLTLDSTYFLIQSETTVRLARGRELAVRMDAQFRIAVIRSCELAGLSRTAWYGVAPRRIRRCYGAGSGRSPI